MELSPPTLTSEYTETLVVCQVGTHTAVLSVLVPGLPTYSYQGSQKLLSDFSDSIRVTRILSGLLGFYPCYSDSIRVTRILSALLGFYPGY